VSPLFKALGDRRAYIVYSAADKHPVDPFTGENSNAQDPATWLTSDVATELAGIQPGHGVGIVISEGSGLFCIDLDHCIQGETLTPAALEIIAQFPGAYIEVSVSGTGIHIMGTCSAPPIHSTKNHDVPAELYTKARYVALTGNLYGSGAQNVLADCTDQLYALAYRYFKPKAGEDAPSEWTTEDDAACTITGTDAQRLALALKSRSAAGMFGSRATFKQLWEADADALAKIFPGTNYPYDQSSADQALFNHMAYWWGNNCERMLTAAQSSGLKRDKWNREDYIRGTILKAASLPKTWKANTRTRPQLPPPQMVQNAGARAPVVTELFTTLAVPPPPGSVPAVPDSMPVVVPAARIALLMRNGKNQIEPSLANVAHVLQSKESKIIAGFDEFRGRLMIRRPGGEWQPLTDTAINILREHFERELDFANVGKEAMRDALDIAGKRNAFDSAKDWLKGIVWDGVPRVERFLTTHCGTPEDAYTRAVSAYIWSGLAGRVLAPGCQLDMVVAFQSPQGRMKSTGFKAMVPFDDFFTDALSLQDANDPDFKRGIKGKLVVEISELAGLSKADNNHIKIAITRTVEEWTEKYQSELTYYQRRCMIFASTNEEQFLPEDETGQRRWLPVAIVTLDRDAIIRDRDQLWAEGREMFNAGGVRWKAAEELARDQHARYEVGDIWTHNIERWLDTPTVGVEATNALPRYRAITVNEVLAGAIGMPTERLDKRAEKRICRCLRQLGFVNSAFRVDGKLVRKWRWDPKIPSPPK
jgi:hypothetical protein